MKIFLDDERKTPEGWVGCRWPNEVIELLENDSNKIELISLDHDLGESEGRTGYDVITWLEEKVYNDLAFMPPKIVVHSANSVGLQRMMSGIKQIAKMIESRKMKESVL